MFINFDFMTDEEKSAFLEQLNVWMDKAPKSLGRYYKKFDSLDEYLEHRKAIRESCKEENSDLCEEIVHDVAMQECRTYNLMPFMPYREKINQRHGSVEQFFEEDFKKGLEIAGKLQHDVFNKTFTHSEMDDCFNRFKAIFGDSFKEIGIDVDILNQKPVSNKEQPETFEG